MKNRLALLAFLILALSCKKETESPRDNLPTNKYKLVGSTLLNGEKVDFDITNTYKKVDGTVNVNFIKSLDNGDLLKFTVCNLKTDSVTTFEDTSKYNFYLLLTMANGDAVYCNLTDDPHHTGWAFLEKTSERDFHLQVESYVVLHPPEPNYCSILGMPADTVKISFNVSLIKI